MVPHRRSSTPPRQPFNNPQGFFNLSSRQIVHFMPRLRVAFYVVALVACLFPGGVTVFALLVAQDDVPDQVFIGCVLQAVVMFIVLLCLTIVLSSSLHHESHHKVTWAIIWGIPIFLVSLIWFIVGIYLNVKVNEQNNNNNNNNNEKENTQTFSILFAASSYINHVF
ncbi:hypothetical protein OIO90_000944 [Microbotryomycetes sp. JL221]|nr:hypothetical protein OIO90_000944 [Microbotryomycetes sp. JL221]